MRSLTQGGAGHRLLSKKRKRIEALAWGAVDKQTIRRSSYPGRAGSTTRQGYPQFEEGAEVSIESLAGGTETTGFRSRTTIDDSPETQRRTRLAVARAKEGDREAIRYLYVTYAHNVYGFVRSILRDDHEAEDVTQHVFAKLMTAIGKYDERGIPFMAWLLRLARNLAIDHLRANRLMPVESVMDPDTSSHDELYSRGIMREALACLPEDQREVVVLRHIMGYKPGEIAAQTGRTESSVHGLHHRGRRALQRELQRLDAAPVTRPPLLTA